MKAARIAVVAFTLVGCAQDKTNEAPSVDAGGEAGADVAAQPGPPRITCASRGDAKCLRNCAANEQCFTPVSCGPTAEAGVICTAGSGEGDDRCHPSCKADSDCPSGERCRDIPFFGCFDFNGGKPRICCRGDGDGGCE